jgi:Cof subfamily protein (haloacid dehalogenase superfamily)
VITETPEDRYVLEEARINKLKVKKIDSFVDYITFPIPKCLVVQEGDHLAKVEKIMSDALGNRFNVFRSEPYFLEIMPKNIDKAYSLSILAKYLHISKEEVVACGDGYNDLTMIGYAGLGIAMKNAQEVVKHKADFVTLSNDEDGIAFAIEKMVAGTI